MSIAYGFEPDVSPIYEDDSDIPDRSEQSVHFSSADTPIRRGRPTNKTLGTTHLFDESSFHNFHHECAPDSSETVPDSTENFVEPSDEVVPDSRDERDEAEGEEVVPDSVGFLSDVFVVLSAGCCIPIKQHLSKCLVEMGANIQLHVDHRTTHVVVDRYADEETVGQAMARGPNPPLMVDVKWIQECVDRRERCEETDYSMRDCRYLKQTCKRLSTFREPTPAGEEGPEESLEWADMDKGIVEDPAELLQQIRRLSERLDALMDYVPIIRFEYHSPDCPTRQRPANFVLPSTQFSPIRPNTQTSKNHQNLQKFFLSTSTAFPIRRRRSFTGFCLEHREPEDPVLQVQLDNQDERKTLKNSMKNQKKSKKTAKNARKNPPKAAKVAPVPPKRRQKPVPVNADDSDIQSALASLTISSPLRQRDILKPAILQMNPEVSRISRNTSNSVEILEIRRREPLVVTKSAFINRLQCQEDSRDDDFISDVSAFRMTQKMEKKQQKETRMKNFQETRQNLDLTGMGDQEEEDRKNAVMFTGFGKEIEKKLKSILGRFKLHSSTELDPSTTRCVVSRHGKRTLLVLKALCLDIPIVRPQWLEESFEDSQLLPHSDYVFPEWTLTPGHNRKNIFSNFLGKFWISAECHPAREELAWMVEQCGGRITRKIQRAELIIAPENWNPTTELSAEISSEILEDIQICTPLFVIDSIGAAELQEISDYLIAT